MGYIFLFLCMPGNFWSDDIYCKFYIVLCLKFLCSCKYAWVFFWDAVKAFWKSLVVLRLGFVRWERRSVQYVLNLPDCLMSHESSGFPLWWENYPYSVWALGIDLTVSLGGSSHSLKFSHNTCSDQHLSKHLREPLCRYLELSLCQNSPPCYPALWNLAASVFVGSLFHLLNPQGLWVPLPPLFADAWQFSLENQPGQSQSLSQLFLFSQGSLSWLCLDKYPEPEVPPLYCFSATLSSLFLCFLLIKTFYFLHWPSVSLNLLILSVFNFFVRVCLILEDLFDF